MRMDSTPRSEWEVRWGTQDELIQRTADYIQESAAHRETERCE